MACWGTPRGRRITGSAYGWPINYHITWNCSSKAHGLLQVSKNFLGLTWIKSKRKFYKSFQRKISVVYQGCNGTLREKQRRFSFSPSVQNARPKFKSNLERRRYRVCLCLLMQRGMHTSILKQNKHTQTQFMLIRIWF